MKYEKEIYCSIHRNIEKLSNLLAKELKEYKIKSWKYHDEDESLKYKLYKEYHKKLFGFINIKKEYSYCTIREGFQTIKRVTHKLIEIKCRHELVNKIEDILSKLDKGFLEFDVILVDAGISSDDYNEKYDVTCDINMYGMIKKEVIINE